MEVLSDELIEWEASAFEDDMLGVPLLERSGSEMSTTSPNPSSSMAIGGELIIEAFCTFTGGLVHLEYPVADRRWVYRADQGGHSTHRWDLDDVVCIVAKHSTCAKALRPKKIPCRNCENKKRWRRECTEACNTFFLFALGDVATATTTIAPLVIRSVGLSVPDMQLYVAHCPKISHKPAKTVDATRMRSMVCRERNLRFSILNGGTGRVLTYPPHQVTGDNLLQLLMDDPVEATEHANTVSSSSSVSPFTPSLVPSVADDIYSTLSTERHDDDDMDGATPIVPPAQSSLLSPLVLRAPAVPSSPNLHFSKQSSPVIAAVLSSPSKNATIDGYDAIVDKLIDYGSDGAVVLDAAFWAALLHTLPTNAFGIVDTVENPALLEHLYRIVGIDRAPKLLVKSGVLYWWIKTAADLAQDLRVYLGFVSFHSRATYDELLRLPLLPDTFTRSEIHIHTSYNVALSATLPGTTPLLCAYHSSHAPQRVFAPRILPIGV